MSNGRAASRHFDWETAKAQLESTRALLESGATAAGRDVAEVLEERARRYSRPVTSGDEDAELEELLEFSCGDRAFAIELRFAKSVTGAHSLTALPAVPACLVGIMHHEAVVLPVFDAGLLMGAEQAGGGEYVVIVQVEGSTFGLRADSVRGVMLVASTTITDPPPTVAQGHARFIRGITEEMAMVVDLERLARDPRVVVERSMQ